MYTIKVIYRLNGTPLAAILLEGCLFRKVLRGFPHFIAHINLQKCQCFSGAGHPHVELFFFSVLFRKVNDSSTSQYALICELCTDGSVEEIYGYEEVVYCINPSV
jgi:hypothetical protein